MILFTCMLTLLGVKALKCQECCSSESAHSNAWTGCMQNHASAPLTTPKLSKNPSHDSHDSNAQNMTLAPPMTPMTHMLRT